MTLIAGTIQGITLVSGNPEGFGARKAYLVTVNFGAYTSADSGTVTGVGAAIAAQTKLGKTNTLRDACCAFPGADTNAQLVYIDRPVVSTDALTFNLSTNAGVELTSATASVGVGLI